MVTPLQRFWYLLVLLGWKDRSISLLSERGVTDFKYLSVQQQEQLNKWLEEEWKNRSKRPRGAVIHYLCIMPNYDFKTAAGEPNYEKIDEWCIRNYKKPLNKLSLSELNRAVSGVKIWYSKEVQKVKS